MGSDLAYAAGPAFYFLFILFPTDLAYLQAATQGTLFRLTGITWAAMAGFYFMLMHFGVRGLLEISKPWRFAVFFTLITLSLLGGFRSAAILLAILFLVQFYIEGLVRSHWFPVFVLGAGLGGVLLVGFIDKMPLSIQRSLSFLPLNVDALARHDAFSTLDWRLEMWKTLLPDVPKYLLMGKGFSYSGRDYALIQEAVRRGRYSPYEDTLINGNYHNGLLTIIIPFGIFGFLAFSWFCWSSLRLLYLNFRFGEDRLKAINTFLLAFFCARLFFYVTFYGQFDLDLFIFTGTVGLSISLNGGVEKAKHGAAPVSA